MRTILIVEDEEMQRSLLKKVFEEKGFDVREASLGREALDIIRTNIIDVVLLDIKLPDISGTEVLREIKSINPEIPVIMVTAFSDVPLVVESMKEGAFHYLTKPLNIDELLIVVRRATEHLDMVREIKKLREKVEAFEKPEEIVFASSVMENIVSLAIRAAQSDASVLITGETGTGKEVIARLIQNHSRRKDKNFVAINLTAIPETLIEAELFGYERGAFTGAVAGKRGILEEADGGTLFLDEIGELPYHLQAKLLRVIETGEFRRLGSRETKKADIRLISATNRDLEVEVKEGRFREDLFYRLNVIRIHIPPLRERREDIPYLLDHFLKKYSKREGKNIKGFTREAYELLLRYDYPGNVRELENIVERAVVLARDEYIRLEDLPIHIKTHFMPYESTGELTLEDRVNAFERSLILDALKKHNWVKTEAAKELGITLRMLRYKMKKLGIKEED